MITFIGIIIQQISFSYFYHLKFCHLIFLWTWKISHHLLNATKIRFFPSISKSRVINSLSMKNTIKICRNNFMFKPLLYKWHHRVYRFIINYIIYDDFRFRLFVRSLKFYILCMLTRTRTNLHNSYNNYNIYFSFHIIHYSRIV